MEQINLTENENSKEVGFCSEHLSEHFKKTGEVLASLAMACHLINNENGQNA